MFLQNTQPIINSIQFNLLIKKHFLLYEQTKPPQKGKIWLVTKVFGIKYESLINSAKVED